VVLLHSVRSAFGSPSTALPSGPVNVTLSSRPSWTATVADARGSTPEASAPGVKASVAGGSNTGGTAASVTRPDSSAVAIVTTPSDPTSTTISASRILRKTDSPLPELPTATDAPERPRVARSEPLGAP
jgi:hypothetical protein